MEKEKFNFEIAPEDKGKRLDKFLVENLSHEMSRSFLQKLVADGHIKIGGMLVKSSHKLTPGEYVEVEIPEPSKVALRAERIPLDIVYEDKYLLVVNKTADMVVHPAPGNYAGTLVNALLEHCKDLSGIGGELKPGIVHRLDKDTSGLLVVAKTDEAHRELAKQFKDKTTRRVYIAIVKGVVELDNGTVELPIGRSQRDRKKMAVSFDNNNSKDALTKYRVIERFKKFTLLEVILGTGRTHQIRVHMAYIGHPILGDAKYGSKDGFSRPALHAKTIGFVHPATKKYMEFTSELPADMREIIENEKKDRTGKKIIG